MAGGRPLRLEWQSEDTAAALATAFRREPDKHVALRLQALWRLRCGEGVRSTARTLGVSERAVQWWVRWYRDGGRAAVCGHRYGATPGRHSPLSPTQEAALRTYLNSGAVHTAWDARDWLQGEYGISYTRKGIYSLLRRLGARPKVPRPSNPKRDPAATAAWKKGGSPTRSRPQASRSQPA